jgi:hypothetical protein
MTFSSRGCLCLAALGLAAIIAPRAAADPLPGELLKFYQMPLNNGLTPYLPGVATFPPILPPGLPYGADPSTAFFPGHDERSTALATAYAPGPNGPVPIAWQGTYMADDFADYAGTPISHVRWWGSYMGQNSTGLQVKKFLISFEHNVPASTDPTGAVIPSHPDPHHPGNLHQIVDLVPGLLPPPPGAFTEKPVFTPIGPGLIPPPEPLMEYNAELHLDKWFYERAASASVVDDVYWLKIVALVDPNRDGPIDWGWHNRDWSIMNPLAAKPGDTPDGAEHIQGFVPGPGGLGQPVWHFEDDAVQGPIIISPGMSPIMPIVEQTGFVAQNYVLPWDGPTASDIQQMSKDLAFELYTRIPEPGSVALAAIGVLVVSATRRRV